MFNLRENFLDKDKSFAVDAVVFSNEFRHSKFVAYKVKDAIEAEEASQFYDFSTDLEFNDLLKTLPEDSRLIFQMYYGEQFSIGEIAQLLHMPILRMLTATD